MDKLKGKKIVNVYHDSAYGKETIPVLDAQAKKYGFTVTHIPVPHPGNEQGAQWLADPADQAGLGDPARLGRDESGLRSRPPPRSASRATTSSASGGRGGGGHDPCRRRGKGYIAAGFNVARHQLPVIRKSRSTSTPRARARWMTRPASAASITTVACPRHHHGRGDPQGQEKYGKKSLTPEQVRWGIENLQISDARLKELGRRRLHAGAQGQLCDHEGGAR